MSQPESRPAIVARLRAAGCVFAEDEADLLLAAATSPAELEAMVGKRVLGLPLEQLLGWAEFCGLRIAVDAGVFVPRRRTAFLVEQGLAAVPVGGPVTVVVLDMCCGSGAVGVALAAGPGAVELYAADIDPAAVRCARRNLSALGGQVFQGDLFAPLPPVLRGRVDILTANAPYVPTDAIGLMPPEARLHEARVALDGGADGLDVQRRLIAGAGAWLAPGGRLLVETSERQAPSTAAAMAAHGLDPRIESSEEFDATVVVGARSGQSRMAVASEPTGLSGSNR